MSALSRNRLIIKGNRASRLVDLLKDGLFSIIPAPSENLNIDERMRYYGILIGLKDIMDLKILRENEKSVKIYFTGVGSRLSRNFLMFISLLFDIEIIYRYHNDLDTLGAELCKDGEIRKSYEKEIPFYKEAKND